MEKIYIHTFRFWVEASVNYTEKFNFSAVIERIKFQKVTNMTNIDPFENNPKLSSLGIKRLYTGK